MERYLGIDVGGTNTKSVALEYGGDGESVIELGSVPTVVDAGPVGVRDQVVALYRSHVAAVGAVKAVGVTIPGMVYVEAGTTGTVPNIAGDWLGFPMGGTISDEIGLPVRLINDARAFSLAEATLGAARGVSTVVCLTLGTGIGGGVVINGKLWRGHTGMAGEIGHQTVDPSPDALVCGCGNPGCLETLTQAEALCRRAGQPDVEAVFAAASAGDEKAREALRAEFYYLAIGMANAYMLLAPDAFVIGGGIAQAGDAIRVPLMELVHSRLTMGAPDVVDIRCAELGSYAGAIGAALWAKDLPGTPS